MAAIRTSVILFWGVILTGRYIPYIIFMIQPQGQVIKIFFLPN